MYNTSTSTWALNAYGEHFKWEGNKENTADKFY